jgi:hypothetical protein
VFEALPHRITRFHRITTRSVRVKSGTLKTEVVSTGMPGRRLDSSSPELSDPAFELVTLPRKPLLTKSKANSGGGGGGGETAAPKHHDIQFLLRTGREALKKGIQVDLTDIEALKRLVEEKKEAVASGPETLFNRGKLRRVLRQGMVSDGRIVESEALASLEPDLVATAAVRLAKIVQREGVESEEAMAAAGGDDSLLRSAELLSSTLPAVYGLVKGRSVDVERDAVKLYLAQCLM